MHVFFANELEYQTILGSLLRYFHLNELSKEEHASQTLMEKVGFPEDVMKVINPVINFVKWIHNHGLVHHYVNQILKDLT